MSDIPLPEEARLEAERFKPNKQGSEVSEKAEPTTEEVENLLLQSLDGVNTLTELSDLFNILAVRDGFKDGLTFLGIDYDDLAQKLMIMARNVRDGNQDPRYAASEVPNFLKATVIKVTETEITQRRNEKEANEKNKYRFEELSRILNGDDASEATLRSALVLLRQLGEYRGPLSKEKPYTMQELSAAVVKVLDLAEKASNAVTYDQVSQRLQAELPTLKGNALDFFARATRIHASLYKQGRVSSLAR